MCTGIQLRADIYSSMNSFGGGGRYDDPPVSIGNLLLTQFILMRYVEREEVVG